MIDELNLLAQIIGYFTGKNRLKSYPQRIFSGNLSAIEDNLLASSRQFFCTGSDTGRSA